MTRTKISGKKIDPTPTVRLQDKIGGTFKGRYVKYNVISGWYTFAAISGDAPITLPDGELPGGKTKYKTVDVAEGTEVGMKSTKAISDALAGVSIGTVLDFKYIGMKKLEGGRRFHEIEIYVEE